MKLFALAVVLASLLLACTSHPDGEWTYQGPGCPDAYENCDPLLTSFESMSLVPLGDWPANPIGSPWLAITCWEGSPLLMLFSSGEEISESGVTSLVVALEGEDPAGVYRSTSADGRSASFGPPVVDEILDLMLEAESEGREVGMAASGEERVEYRFNTAASTATLQGCPVERRSRSNS